MIEGELSKRRRITGKSCPSTQMSQRQDGNGESSASTSVLQGNRSGPGSTSDIGNLPVANSPLDDIDKDERKRRRITGSSHQSTQMSRECDAKGEVSAGTAVLQSNHPGPDSTADEGSWPVGSSPLAGGGNDEEKNNGQHRKPSFLRSSSFSSLKSEQGS